jgi:DNA repair photolyase
MELSTTVAVRVGKSTRDYALIEKPIRHIAVNSSKELHGWWPGKRECTAERMLTNPYNGCSVNCSFCYSRALPGYFQIFRQKGVVTVCLDFDRVVAEQLDDLEIAACGYLSPVTDPFQPLNNEYRLSERIIEAFVSRNIPVEFVTKECVPDKVIQLMKTQPHSFGQFSILTLNEPLRRQLMEGGATTDELFEGMSRMAAAGLHAVCRIDPIIPYITDRQSELRDLIQRASDSGARHVVASVMDICLSMTNDIYERLFPFGNGVIRDMKKLYHERIDSSMQADINYRKRIFDLLRNVCDKAGVTFALCMEYGLIDGVPVGLNEEFMSSTNCEGIDIPIYVRSGDHFRPAASCNGACLSCTNPECGVDDLALGKIGWQKPGFKLSDYRRWSRQLIEARQERLA